MIYIYNSVSKKKREIKYFMIYLISEINWKQKNKLHISYYDLEKFRRVLFQIWFCCKKRKGVSIERKFVSTEEEEDDGRVMEKKRGKRKGKKVLRDFNDGEKVSVE